MKLLKKTGFLLLVAFLIAQFFSPKKNSGSTEDLTAFFNETKPSETVKKVLESTCFDCHSSNTNYPWYNNITPVNYWLDSHVKDGRKHLDFSKWADYSVKIKDHKFEDLKEKVVGNKMPLPSYTWTHGDANLTDVQIQAIMDWVEQVRIGYLLVPKPE